MDDASKEVLDLTFSCSFQCSVCAYCTLVGFRKDLLSALQEPARIFHESQHSDRVFLRSVKGRELFIQGLEEVTFSKTTNEKRTAADKYDRIVK